MDAEIDKRIASAGYVFHQLGGRVWGSGSLSTRTKVQLYTSLVLSVLLYAAETWTLTHAQLGRLEVFHNRCVRRLKGVSLLDRVRTTDLHAMAPRTATIASSILKFRLRWIGHLARRQEDYLPRQMLFAYRLGTGAVEGEGRGRRGGRVGREEEGRGDPPAPTVRGRTVTSYAIDMHHQLGELNVTRRVWGEGTRRTQRAFDFDSWYSCARDREKWKAFIESATNEPREPIPAGG
jgi:hypothetical protein